MNYYTCSSLVRQTGLWLYSKISDYRCVVTLRASGATAAAATAVGDGDCTHTASVHNQSTRAAEVLKALACISSMR